MVQASISRRFVPTLARSRIACRMPPTSAPTARARGRSSSLMISIMLCSFVGCQVPEVSGIRQNTAAEMRHNATMAAWKIQNTSCCRDAVASTGVSPPNTATAMP